MLSQIFIELQLITGERIDEGRDELEETPNCPRDCHGIILEQVLQKRVSE